MSKLKEVIKDASDLEQAIETVLPEAVRAVTETIGHLYPEYKRALNNQLTIGIFLVLLFCGVIFVFASPQLFHNPNTLYVLAGLVFFVGLGVEVWYTRKRYNLIIDFNRQFKEITLPHIGVLFGLEVRLLQAGTQVFGYATRNKKRSSELTLIRDLIAHSELMTDPTVFYEIGDIIAVRYNNRQLLMAEIRVPAPINRTRNVVDHPNYTGYFISVDLDKPVQAKTFITTQEDVYGFGNRSPISEITNSGVQETMLEWNAFERVFRVTGTDPVEARYILTPNVMEDLLSWWVQDIVRYRVSFINNKMSLLLPDKAMVLSDGFSIHPASIKWYLRLISKPLLRTLHLLEDMRY